MKNHWMRQAETLEFKGTHNIWICRMKPPFHPSVTRRHLLLTSVFFAGVSLAWPGDAAERAAKDKNTGVAIRGYDTTAYFQKARAVKGALANSVNWDGAVWQFETAEEAVLFTANPEAYAPQFGGYCTRAMSFSSLVPADPEVWRIRNGKLYMFAKPVGGTYFDKSPDKMITLARAYWDSL
jgi:hypothetical protein